MRQNQHISLGRERSKIKVYCTLHQTKHPRYIFSIGRKVLTAQKQRGGFNFDIYVIYVSLICGRGLSAMLLRMAKKAVVGSMVRLARQWRASGGRRTASRIYNLYDMNLNQNTTVCTAKFDEQFVMLIPKNVFHSSLSGSS